MTNEDLRQRCCRIIGLHPESTVSILGCMRMLSNLQNSSRAIAAEMLARELAEYVSEQPNDPPPPQKS